MRWIIIFLISLAGAKSNQCQLLFLDSKAIHLSCKHNIQPNDLKIYDKQKPNRMVIAFPKGWQLTVPKNKPKGVDVKFLKQRYYLVIEKKYMPKIDTSFRNNHVTLMQPSYTQKCDWVKVNKPALSIVIDPGHGGHDPGTVVNGVKEKHVALTFAKQLQQAFKNKNRSLNIHLTRLDDRYVSLDQRRFIAQKNHADIFISIHADGSPNQAARGLSIFSLSNAGASSTMAKLIAAKENRVSVKASKALLSFDREININRSRELSQTVLNHLSQSVSLHTNRPEYANFSVLRSLNMPSCLIEVGFLSNDEDRGLLLEPFYQKFLANQIASSMLNYLKPHNTEMTKTCRIQKTNNWVIVKAGDNLSNIAKKHRSTVKALTIINDLQSSVLKKNQKLYLT